MKKIILLVGILIAILGYNLRYHQFFHFPPLLDTHDELKAVFNGVSLIKSGVPRSWSWFDVYGYFPIVNFRGNEYAIVEPWFEEPPLFSLIVGSYAIARGMDTFEKIDPAVMRSPMLWLGALNIFLLFYLVYLIRGPLEASIASLVYATVPTFVLGSRLPISENMITTSMLLSLVLFVAYLKKPKKWIIVLTALIGSSAFLMKQSGIFVPISLVLLFLAFKKKEGAIIFLTLAIFIVGYLFYGFYYNWDLFVKMISAQSGRELSNPGQIINLFEVFRIAESAMSTDGWIVWGWICVTAYSFIRWKDKNLLSKLVLPVTIGSYLVFFSIMSGHNKGWYRFPFYPFLAWASAAVFIESVKNPRFLATLFFIGIPFSSSYIYGNGEYKWNASEIKNYQIALVSFMALPMLYELLGGNQKLKIVVQSLLIGAFVLAIIYNIQTIMVYQDQFWY